MEYWHRPAFHLLRCSQPNFSRSMLTLSCSGGVGDGVGGKCYIIPTDISNHKADALSRSSRRRIGWTRRRRPGRQGRQARRRRWSSRTRRWWPGRWWSPWRRRSRRRTSRSLVESNLSDTDRDDYLYFSVQIGCVSQMFHKICGR